MDSRLQQPAVPRWKGVAGFAGGSVALCLAVVVSAESGNSRFGAPLYWAWLITALQVVALWGAGARRWWGWLLGAAVQPAWVVYALLTAQLGFIPGCLFSGAVQLASFVRSETMREAKTGCLSRRA